jgi:hypothetical protein
MRMDNEAQETVADAAWGSSSGQQSRPGIGYQPVDSKATNSVPQTTPVALDSVEYRRWAQRAAFSGLADQGGQAAPPPAPSYRAGQPWPARPGSGTSSTDGGQKTDFREAVLPGSGYMPEANAAAAGVAQTSPVDVGSRAYRHWKTQSSFHGLGDVGGQQNPTPEFAAETRPQHMPAPIEAEGNPIVEYIHCYRNYRWEVDWNTCGQAAIATMVDFWGLDPWGLPRPRYDWMNGRYFWDDGAAIDAVRNDFPPDVVFGLGTTGGTIRNALEYYGLGNAAVAWSGIFSTGWQDRWRELQNYLAWGYPVPVLVDCGALGGPWYTAHWAIAHKVADNRVHLGAMGGIGSSPTIDEFLHAWQCSFLPAGFNHCGVYSFR